jgi:hypothetical protein
MCAGAHQTGNAIMWHNVTLPAVIAAIVVIVFLGTTIASRSHQTTAVKNAMGAERLQHTATILR